MITFEDFITEAKSPNSLFVSKTHKKIPFRFRENGETMTGVLHVGQMRGGLNKGKVKAVIHSNDRGSSHTSKNSWDSVEDALEHQDLQPFQSDTPADYGKHIRSAFETY